MSVNPELLNIIRQSAAAARMPEQIAQSGVAATITEQPVKAPAVAALEAPVVTPVVTPAVVAPAAIAADAGTVAAPVATPVVGEIAKAAAIIKEPDRVFKAARVVADATDPSIIIGIGAVAGNLDLDDEMLAQKAMADMAHQFCSSSTRKFKMNHEHEIKADLVESWVGAPIYKLTDGSLKVVKAAEDVPDGAAFAGISNEELSHWFIAVRPEDQTLVKKAAAGTFGGFSWGGWVDKTEVSE